MLLVLIFLFVLGTVFGSFVSAISWRIPNGISFVKGRSICPKCRSQINWYDNIPILSYLILSGKCRNCFKKISLRYPIIEFVSGFGFVLIFLFAGYSNIIKLIYYLAIFIILLTIFIIDLENQIIPDELILSGLIVVIVYSFISSTPLLYLLFSGLTAASFLLFINLITNGKGMGLGDVKFALLGGAITGMKLLPGWLFSAFLTGALTGCILILLGLAKFKSKISFGPFLIIGLLVVFVFGEKILSLVNFI